MLQVCWRPLLRLRGPFRFCLVLLRKQRQGIFECRQRLIMRRLVGLWALVGERQETSLTKKKVGSIMRGARLDTSLKLTKKTFSWNAPLATLHLKISFTSRGSGVDAITAQSRNISVKIRVVFSVLFHDSYVLL